MLRRVKIPIIDTPVHDPPVGTTSVNSVFTGVGIIGRGLYRAISGGRITLGMIHGGTSIISSNVITHVLTDSRKMILKSDSFPFNPLKSKTLVIALPTEPFLSCDRDVRVSSEIGDSRPGHGRIGTPFVNKKIWSGDDKFSVRSDVGEADKLNTSVQRSSTDERNTASSQIEEESLEIIFPKIIKESNLSERMNLTNSLSIETSRLVSFGHLPMGTENVGHRIDVIVATRIEDPIRIWRSTNRDDRMARTHDDIETISEKIAYRKHIRDSEFETREVLERETSNQNIENIGTRLNKNRLDDNQMTRSMDSSKRSKKHKPEVKTDPGTS